MAPGPWGHPHVEDPQRADNIVRIIAIIIVFFLGGERHNCLFGPIQKSIVGKSMDVFSPDIEPILITHGPGTPGRSGACSGRPFIPSLSPRCLVSAPTAPPLVVLSILTVSRLAVFPFCRFAFCRFEKTFCVFGRAKAPPTPAPPGRRGRAWAPPCP